MTVETIGNLLKSKATMWIAPYGEALPDETTVAAAAAWGGNWAKLGWTKQPLAFRYEFDEAEFNIEQALGVIERRKIAERATFETVLAEATGNSLAYAVGLSASDLVSTAAGAGQKAFEALSVGNEVILDKFAVGFEGITYDSAGTAQPIRVFFTRATLMLNGELSFSQRDDDYVGVPVQVKALTDVSNSYKLLTWHRVTAPASS